MHRTDREGLRYNWRLHWMREWNEYKEKHCECKRDKAWNSAKNQMFEWWNRWMGMRKPLVRKWVQTTIIFNCTFLASMASAFRFYCITGLTSCVAAG